MKCTLCPKAFNTKMVLDKHTKNVHETPGYPCNDCDKVFNTLFNLKRHKEKHCALTPVTA